MNHLSLFSGIGGDSLAAEWAGMKTVAFCEREPFPQKVLRKHWPDVPIYDDVCTLSADRLKEDGIIGPGRTIDILSGGFPCQPFSIAGQKKGRDDDRDLWPEMFRIIQEIRPTWVVGENVANFVNMELERTLIDLESEGYETQTFIIPACGVDAKHQRYRTFVVAHTDSNEQWPWDGLQQSKRDTARKCVSYGGAVERVRVLADSYSKGLQGARKPETLAAKGRNRSNSLPDAIRAEQPGQLNPTWVEWLMGFPTGWTDLNHSETL
ncbi:DNA cytosine methyltransferase [Paenibacillus macquariensis]|uniref:DNA (cytosine-5-)-methyltransferase n=1 Tax=Paenibacillus macquariensis TaxID=948756 RepID=A0ABY1JM37_9BACL|nr:DNA cytosine methyltransferase [Paenibacillus macquariensis]SIQ44868.1 Site-specific DNA-cytosine methylase [Paenibacillus macquariensis]